MSVGGGSIKPSPSRVALLRSRESRRKSRCTLFFPAAQCLSAYLPLAGNMAHHTSDPTKMGVGRSIAVLTSGGDAQGKRRTTSFYGSLWFYNCKKQKTKQK